MIVSPQKYQQYIAFADNVAFAQNKQHISIFNGSTNKVIRLRRLYAVNLALAAVTGVACRFDYKRITALDNTGLITPAAFETGDAAALDALIKVSSCGGATESTLMYANAMNNDEVPALNTVPAPFQSADLLSTNEALKQMTLLPGEGFTVKQITASTVGTFGWVMVFTQEQF